LRNAGKRLPFLELHPARILGLLESVDLIDSVILFKRVESTNIIASKFLDRDLEGGILIVAEVQTKGKGRKGRVWYSSEGKSLTFTVILSIKNNEGHVAEITPLFAITIVSALEQMGIEDVRIKWPNDIMVHGKKLCGILAETKGSRVIVGVGINVNEEESDLSVVDIPATSLRIELGKVLDRGKVLVGLLIALDNNFKIWSKKHLGAFKEGIEKRLMYLGKEVQVIDDRKLIRGRILGINDEGCLILDVSGRKLAIPSGDLSLKG